MAIGQNGGNGYRQRKAGYYRVLTRKFTMKKGSRRTWKLPPVILAGANSLPMVVPSWHRFIAIAPGLLLNNGCGLLSGPGVHFVVIA